MKQELRSRRSALVLAVIAAGTAFALLTAASSSPAKVAARHAMSPAIGGVSGSPTISGPVAKPPHPGDLFSCQPNPLSGAQGPRCYVPQQIQQAYGYSGLLASGVDGSGKTIVIVDAYSNPYIAGDLALEDNVFGLPAPPSFTAVAPQGVPSFDPSDANQVGWAEEITLDVEWAHVMAPGASIVLVEAKSNDDSDILAALQYAVDHNLGDVISQSFGENEACTGNAGSLNSAYHAVYQEAVDKGMTVFASSGDSGAAQFNCAGTGAVLAASSPASDPLVTGVGGTTLNASNSKGVYGSETAWTEIYGCNPPALDYPVDVNCSGGGYSTIYDKPTYQDGFVSGSYRGVPDVSYNAGVNGGVITVCSVCNGGTPAFFLFGGTSAGSPQWAALIADADQMAGSDLGNINPQLYSLAGKPGPGPFHDIVKGNNYVAEIGAGYNAHPGWDPVTGLGSPNAATLLPALAGVGGPPGNPGKSHSH